MPDLDYDRLPSLPATEDGNAGPLAGDPSSGSGDGEDVTWDAHTADPGEVPEAAGAEAGPRPAAAEPRDGEAGARPEMAGPEGEAEFTEADVAFLSAPPEAAQGNVAPGSAAGLREADPGTGEQPSADATASPDTTAGANGTEGAPGADAAPETGESGRWFRSAKAKKKYVPIRPEEQDGSAGHDVAGADAEPGGAVATEDPAEQAAAPAASAPPDGIRRRLSRRTMLQAGLIGGAGVAALPLLALAGGIARPGEQPASLSFSMNTNWLFGGQYMVGSETSVYDDSSFAPVTLPHTVTELSWKDWDFPGWQQVWIYRRHFSGSRLIDSHRPGSRIFVDFDGVMVNASVAINDQVVGHHQGGYLPFSAELTGKVRADDNLLAVIVDARCLPVPPFGMGRGPASVDFFQPGGIYRDVRLRVLPQMFLADLFARPADVLTSRPRVDIEYTVDSAAGHADGTLLVELLDGQARISAQAAQVKVTSPGTSTGRLSLTGFGQVSLWSPDSPKLYTVQATLSVPGLGSHVLTRRIGFREASFRPEGFFLNGKRMQLFGLNRHQLYPYAGMAMPARVQRKDAEILKNEFNCNMVRCSHYPQSPAFLDACDELGLLVWEEAPGWHNVSTSPAWQDLVVQNVRGMVVRDRSRPSVIVWGTRLNETPDIPGLWAATRQAARELDGSRPSTGAIAFQGVRSRHEHGSSNEDVFAYNDYGIDHETGDVLLTPPAADLPYLITEAIGVMEAKPMHFAWTDPPTLLARQAALHGQAQSQARTRPGYAGLLGWAGFDYGSMFGHDRGVKWAGVADGFRVPKPGAAIYQSQADPAVRPVIIPVFFWEAGGAVPAPNPTVMIASNCERLEVFIGGRHVASALPASGSPLYGGLAHPPFLVRLPKRIPAPVPELLIQGFAGGRLVATVRMSADPPGDALAMTVDDAAISADGSDATRAVFRAVDAHGNQRRYGSGEVVLALSGPARLVGDNPFAFGHYGGLGAVWIRSRAGQPGVITLTASHPRLGQAEVQVRSELAAYVDELA